MPDWSLACLFRRFLLREAPARSWNRELQAVTAYFCFPFVLVLCPHAGGVIPQLPLSVQAALGTQPCAKHFHEQTPPRYWLKHSHCSFCNGSQRPAAECAHRVQLTLRESTRSSTRKRRRSSRTVPFTWPSTTLLYFWMSSSDTATSESR